MKCLSKAHEHEYQTIQPPSISPVPGLTTQEECAYLYWLASHCFEGKGAVVEIGTWLGHSAGYLAAGLRAGKHRTTLHCFDRFQLNEREQELIREQGFDPAIPVGADTRPYVEQHLAPFSIPCILHKTDISTISWNQGAIELLHLDAPKRSVDVFHALKTLSPHFIPQATVLVAQDFLVPRAYTLPLIFAALSDALELVHVPAVHSTMATFAVRKPIIIDDRYDVRAWDTHRAITLMEHWLPFFHPEQQSLLYLGLALYCYDTGDESTAQVMLDKADSLSGEPL